MLLNLNESDTEAVKKRAVMISIGKIEELDSTLKLTRSCAQHMRDNRIDQRDADYPNREDILQDLQTQTVFAYREDFRDSCAQRIARQRVCRNKLIDQ